ncbi:VPA1269 family protein [Herbaspirillum huttiense]|uniref:VPA1269 family protein n=1 Tax=Herbaspirillum huttiense TaxID=863372 RepID=UPI0031DEF7D1
MAEDLIFGTEGYSTFSGAVSGKQILFNDDPERFHVLYIPSETELRAFLTRYVQLRLKDVWYWYGRIVAAGERTGLAAFTSVEGNRMFHIRGGYLMSKLPGMYSKQGKGRRYEGIHHSLSARPLEEQRGILEKVKPSTMPELQEALIESAYKHAMAYSPLSLVAEPCDFVSVLRRIIAELKERKSIAGVALDVRTLARHQDILLLMALEGWILLPVRYGSFGVVGQYDRFLLSGCYLPDKSAELIENTYRMLGASMRDSEAGKRALRTFIFSSNVRCLEDLSPDIVGHFERVVATKLPGSTNAKSGAYVVGDILRTIFERKYPDQPFGAYRSKDADADQNKKSPSFKRVEVLYPDRPDLHHWAALFAKYVECRERRNVVHIIYYLWRFIDYLAQLSPFIANPGRIVRHQHIRDRSGVSKTTYFSFLEKSNGAQKPKNAAIQELRRFFDWYLDYQVAASAPDKLDKNPVNPDDAFGLPTPKLGMSHRFALPEFVLDAIKDTIVADNFAFPKSRELDYFETIDEAGNPARIWYPGTAICMYFLLDQPVRLKQARWLDDGLFDADRLAVFQTNIDGKVGYSHRIIPNDSAAKISGRRQGVLRAISDFGKMESFVGLFINTNKTDDYGGVTPNGYEIPYVPPKLLDLLLYMREWQRHWMPPLDALVPYLDGEDLNEKFRDKVPLVSPLFRDPLGSTRRRPLSDGRLRRFYVDVLLETERRLQEKGYTLDNGFNVQLTRETEQASGRRSISSAYDVHTLRVSGITALINRGVPLEVVSHYVANHKTLAMTLWYFKPSAGQCRDVLLDAYSNRRDEFAAINGDFAKSPELQANWEAYSKHFLSNLHNDGQSDALHALDEGRGIWRIQPDGICPGTDCSTGFLYESDKGKGYYGAVPGGKTCSLCRYWITGPMFLLGQTIRMNSVMLAVEKKSGEARSLKDMARAQEAGRDWNTLHATRARLHELEEELEIHVNDWHARLRFLSASLQQLDDFRQTKAAEEGQDKSFPVPWVSSNTSEGLNVLLDEADSFVLLDSVVQGIQFVPGMANVEAKLDHQRLLNGILRKGGAKHLLLDLPEDVATEAGNILSSRLIQAASTNGVDIRKVLNGEVHLNGLTVIRDGQPVSLLEDLNTLLEAASNSRLELSKPLLQNR